MKQLAPIGLKQYEKFAKDMADTQTPSSLNEQLTKNMLPFFRLKAEPSQSSAKNKLDSLKETSDYFRYYLSHAKARKVTCRQFFYKEIKTVTHPYHKKARCLTFLSKVQI